MTTKTKSKKPTKQRGQQPAQQAKARPKTAISRGVPIPRQHMDTVIGIVNPFSPQAKGSKYPDESSAKTLPYQRHQRFTVSSSAGGNGGCVLLPNYNYEFLVLPASVTSSQITLPTTVAAVSGQIDADSYRIVSWGIKISSICAPLTVAGMTHIRGFTAANGLNLVIVDGTTYNASFTTDVATHSVDGLVVIGQVADMDSTMFLQTNADFQAGRTLTAPTQAWVRNGWNAVSVMFTGAPASTVILAIELVVNYELMFKDDDSLALLTTTSPAFDGHVHNAHKTIRSKMKNVFVKGTEALAKHAVEQAGSALANYLAPGSGRAASAMIRDVD